MLNMPKAKVCVKLQRGRLQWKTDIIDWVQGRGQQMSLCFAEWYQCWYQCSSTEGVATPDQSGASNPAVTDMTSGFNTEQLSQVGRYDWLWYLFFVLLPFCNVCIAKCSAYFFFYSWMWKLIPRWQAQGMGWFHHSTEQLNPSDSINQENCSLWKPKLHTQCHQHQSKQAQSQTRSHSHWSVQFHAFLKWLCCTFRNVPALLFLHVYADWLQRFKKK